MTDHADFPLYLLDDRAVLIHLPCQQQVASTANQKTITLHDLDLAADTHTCPHTTTLNPAAQPAEQCPSASPSGTFRCLSTVHPRNTPHLWVESGRTR